MYAVNGKTLRTCSVNVPGAAFVDISIHNNNGGFLKAMWVNHPKSRMVRPVGLKNMGCVTASGSGLVKTSCGNRWNGGAISKTTRTKNAEIEVHCTQHQHSMIGFSAGADSSKSYNDIDCAH